MEMFKMKWFRGKKPKKDADEILDEIMLRLVRACLRRTRKRRLDYIA